MADETMTLEELRNWIEGYPYSCKGVADAIDICDALIRERDALVKALAEEASARTYAENLLEDRESELAAERDELLARIATLQSEVAKQINISAQSDAALAALRKRVAAAPMAKVIQWYQESKDRNRRVIHYHLDSCYVGQRVRLLVEDDDDSH